MRTNSLFQDEICSFSQNHRFHRYVIPSFFLGEKGRENILILTLNFLVEKSGELWGNLYLCGEKEHIKVRTHEIHRQHRRKD